MRKVVGYPSKGMTTEPQSGAVWREDLCAILCQRLLISRRSRQGWCCLRRLQWQACAPIERGGKRWSPSGEIQTDGLAGTVTGIQLESGTREETGRFRDVKRCVATGDRTRVSGFSLLRHNRWTTAARSRYHRTAPQSCHALHELIVCVL